MKKMYTNDLRDGMYRLIAASLFAVLAGCMSNNLFKNGSFEEDAEPWFSLKTENWNGFWISDRYAVDGRYSVHLPLRGEVGAEGTMIFGAIQEVSPAEFPNRISGYYRVENWKRGTKKQYLQFVVIVWGDQDTPQYANIQIRYIIDGITAPPFMIGNGRFIFLGSEEPQQSAWIPFHRDLRADFIEKWGHVPRGFEKIRFLFETRYDDKTPEEGNIRADVYFDQLYLGK
jgi:hypothetical protein